MNEPMHFGSQVLAQRTLGGSLVVTLDANGWVHLLKVLDWTRDAASRGGTLEIEHAAAHLLTALRQAEPGDHPFQQGPQQDWANEE